MTDYDLPRRLLNDVIKESPELVAKLKARKQPKKRVRTAAIKSERDDIVDALIGTEGHDPKLRKALYKTAVHHRDKLDHIICRDVADALTGDNKARLRALRLLRALPVIRADLNEMREQRVA